jgi:hypothetical protein
VYISNATDINVPAIKTTLAATTSTITSKAVNTGGTDWTAANTVFINGTGTGATATAAIAAGAIIAITMTNNCSGYSSTNNIVVYSSTTNLMVRFLEGSIFIFFRF